MMWIEAEMPRTYNNDGGFGDDDGAATTTLIKTPDLRFALLGMVVLLLPIGP